MTSRAAMLRVELEKKVTTQKGQLSYIPNSTLLFILGHPERTEHPLSATFTFVCSGRNFTETRVLFLTPTELCLKNYYSLIVGRLGVSLDSNLTNWVTSPKP